MDNTKEIGKRFQKIRKELKLKQSQIAEETGVSDAVIKNLEGGRTKSLNMPIINYFCQKYNINIDWILKGEGEPIKEISTEDKLCREYNFSEPEKIMLENYTKLSNEERKNFTNYLMKLLGINNITSYASSTDSNLRDDIIDEVDEENSKNDIDKSHNIRNS